MKKLTSFLLIVCILVASLSTTALAANVDTNSVPKIENTIPVSNSMFSVQSLNRDDYDLSSEGSITLNIKNLEPDTPRVSNYNYITNSTRIAITMKSDIACSVTVSLYDASTDNRVAATTVSVNTTFEKSIAFNGLISTEKYYLHFENNSTQTVAITGSISD